MKHVPLAAAAPILLAAAPGPASLDAPKLPPGYLQRDALPDSLALLPPPPPAGSAAFARDEEVSRQTAQQSGSPRWNLAASDADLRFPHALSAFGCALGVAPDPVETPALYRLLGRMTVDVGLSTYKAKEHYQRVRPFVAHGNATCLPADEAMLREDGSYPSGHSALGWGWALVLTELAPDRADTILQRGRDFGQSRLVCNAHWASDVDAGRLVAAATVARLHADPVFKTDLASARKELAGKPRSAPADCAIAAD